MNIRYPIYEGVYRILTLLKATNKGSFFIGLNLECIICFISVRIFLFHHTAMHPLVYGNDALFAGLHEYIAYHIAPV